MSGMTFSALVPLPALIALMVTGGLISGYALIRRSRAAGFRCLAILILGAAVLDPRATLENRRPLDDIAVVVIDESQSQQLSDRPERTADTAQRLNDALDRLDATEIRTVRLTPESAGARSDGTRLFEAISKATADIPSRRLAGVIAVTDGIVHDAPIPANQSGLTAPLHVLLTGQRSERDRRIVVVEAPEFGLVDKTVPIQIRAEDTGVADGTPIAATLRSDGGAMQQFSIRAGETLEFLAPLEHPGANVFELELAPAENEISPRNNRTLITVNAIRDRLKVLLISGQPHVGERSWRNLLKSDPNVDLVHFTILRPLSKDDGTPLNELALISFPIRELFEEQLYDFDLVIFDRYSRRGLVPFQFMMNIASYVLDGGAVMLSVGPEYADSFSLFDSPLQSVLPAAPTGVVYDRPFLPQLSDTGQPSPGDGVPRSTGWRRSGVGTVAAPDRRPDLVRPGTDARRRPASAADAGPRRQGPRRLAAQRHHLAVGQRLRRWWAAGGDSPPAGPLADEGTGTRGRVPVGLGRRRHDHRDTHKPGRARPRCHSKSAGWLGADCPANLHRRRPLHGTGRNRGRRPVPVE